MRIAQVAPLWEQVPPPAYGGTELVVAHLANELVRQGHEVTLFATANSRTEAKLEPGAPQAMRLAGVTPQEYQAYELMQLTKIMQRADEFDVIHFHIDVAALPYGNILKTPVVHTVHGILPPVVETLFHQNRKQNYVSISDSQRRNDLGLNYVATVYNGIDPGTYEFHPKPNDPPYLTFFGRISPEKGPHLAIELAKRTGWRLVMAGKVDRADQEFYEREIKHLIDGEQIIYVGEANHVQKSEIMGGAVATLCLLTWEEPFGLVMPESMVCGTPVIAMARGSAPELIVHGETGFLCHNMDDCVAAVEQIYTIDRKACRTHVERNFSHTRMVEGYANVYHRLIEQRVAKNGYLSNQKLTPVGLTF